MLYNENDGKQTEVKISHAKSMDDLHLCVHPAIANTELTFQPINNHSNVTNTFLKPPKNRKIILVVLQQDNSTQAKLVWVVVSDIYITMC